MLTERPVCSHAAIQANANTLSAYTLVYRCIGHSTGCDAVYAGYDSMDFAVLAGRPVSVDDALLAASPVVRL